MNSKVKHSTKDIELIAREIQIDLYRAGRLGKNSSSEQLIDIFDPAVALNRYGFSVETVDAIGYSDVAGRRCEVAATINLKSKRIEIAAGFPLPVQRFVLAHELGHFGLDHELEVMHRDLPLEKGALTYRPLEADANKFASVFLIPEKLLLAQFISCFGTDRLKVNHESAWLIFGVSDDVAYPRYKHLRQITDFIARTGTFAGRQFKPLHQQFRVSPTAMAIRLEELRLVEGWGW